MHWLLFIHKILFFSKCFEPQELIFRRIQLYKCILLKMSTWSSKHVEENSILWINNNQCIKVGNYYIVKKGPFCTLTSCIWQGFSSFQLFQLKFFMDSQFSCVCTMYRQLIISWNEDRSAHIISVFLLRKVNCSEWCNVQEFSHWILVTRILFNLMSYGLFEIF